MATDTSDTSTGKTPFIDANTAYDAFTQSNLWLRPYFEPIDEYYRIARNRPKAGIPQEYPKLTEGTTSALTQENPKRVIQQIATGIIEDKDNPAYARIADLVHSQYLIPKYKFMGTKLQKDWNMQTGAIITGRQASYTFMTSENGVFYMDYSLPFIKDVITEKGKVVGSDSNYIFMRSWYSKSDFKAIIARKDAGWDYKLLADLIDTDSENSKPADLQTPAEKERGGTNHGGYEIIHAFQKGVGATFYSFSPKYKEGKILRTKVNKDPRGKIPIDFEYCNIDLSNPLGRGMVELAGPIQNLMDQKLQMHSYMSTLLMAPPLMSYGNVNKASLKYRPNAIWDMGANQNNIVKPLDISNTAIESFVPEMQFLQSKIYSLFASQDNSIPAGEGNVGQSKTSAGVKTAAARVGVADNYFLKQHEAWFEAQAETSINTFFAEMKNPLKMQLKGEDLKEIMESPAAEYVDQQGVLTVPFQQINDISFKFTVDASSSEVKEDQDNAQKLTEVAQAIQQSQDPQLLQELPKIYKLIIGEIGAEGTDDIFKEETDENGQPVQQAPQGPDPAQVQQMVAQMVQEAMQAEKSREKTLAEKYVPKKEDLSEAEFNQILEQGGIEPDTSGALTPGERQEGHDQALELDDRSHQQSMAIQQAADSRASTLDSQQQSQDQFDATQQANQQSQIMQMLQQREQQKAQAGQSSSSGAQ